MTLRPCWILILRIENTEVNLINNHTEFNLDKSLKIKFMYYTTLRPIGQTAI